MEFKNIKKIASIVKTGILGNHSVTLEDFINFVKNTIGHIDTAMFAVAYMDNGIFIGKFDKNAYVFKFYNNYPLKMEYLQKIRIFNENEELNVWRTFDGDRNFIYGFRHIYDIDNADTASNNAEDGDVRPYYCKDVNQILLGTKIINIEERFVELNEERGLSIVMPNEGFKVDDGKNRIAIKTRNYIDFGRNFIASYIDARFLKFVQLPEQKEE